MKKSTGGNARPPLQVVADFVFHGDGRALSPAEKVTAFAIASHTNRKSGRTDPSDERIAHVSGLDVKTVGRAVPKLGGLYSFQRGGSERGARRRATTYTLRATPDTTPPVRRGDPGHSVQRPRTFTSVDPGHHAPLTKEGNQGGEPRITGTPKKGGGPPPRESWLKTARSVWAESVGAPPSWFDTDLLPLVTPSRTGEAVLLALRAYVAGVPPEKAGTGDFARRIGAWMKRGAKPEAAGEPYRATPEQIAEKSRRYLKGEDIAS